MTFRSTDKAKCLDELGGALWREVYLRNDNLTIDHVMRLAHYVDNQLNVIMKMPKEDLFNGDIKWIDPPDWKNVVSDDGYQLPELTEDDIVKQREEQVKEIKEQGGVYVDEESLEEGWRIAYTEAGKVYYWNVESRESSWEPVFKKV
jgi:hypothetical protein